MTRRELLGKAAAAATAAALPSTVWTKNAEYDTVVLRGRVIDPETKLDAIRSIGIRNGRIAAISRSELKGKRTIDAAGLVVAPGFIDPIAHGQNLRNDRLQILDGVTTKLQMESGAENASNWYKAQAGQRLCNYGAGAGHGYARSAVMHDRDDEVGRAATDQEIRLICDHIESNLKQGALGVGFGLEYRPATSRWEVMEAFRVAAKFGASCHCHIRYGTLEEDTGVIAAIQEVMAVSMATGAPLHICHVPSMALRNTGRALELIDRAQKRGFDITCDFYPYTAFGTGIGSEVFAGDWQKKFGMTYGDLEWAKTHERLTPESFEKYRAQGGFVIAHGIPESAVGIAASHPIAMVGSDGRIDEEGVGHPRSAGTFARVIGRYCRDQKKLTLMQALEKMTVRTAKRFERRCADFKRKGRIQIGADADVVAFDFQRIADRATFDKPAETSVGVQYVWVHGNLAVSEGKLTGGAPSGRAMRGSIAR